MNLFKWRGGSGNNTTPSGSTQSSKPSYTPFVKGIAQLVDEGPPRVDGSDKFFGMENVVNGEKFGNTCYCNSILQSLYFSKSFRECVVNYPQRSMLSSNDISSVSSTFIPTNGNGSAIGPSSGGKGALTRISTEPASLASNTTSPNSTVRSGKSPLSPTTPKDDSKRKSIPMIAAVQVAPQGKLEDPNAPETKKKAALAAGPLLKVDASNFASYGMHESLFSALKDIFETIITHTSRTGVISPLKFVEILKKENEMFRSSVHQDAHEFLNYVLNQIIENVEQYQKKVIMTARANGNATQTSQLLSPGSLTPGPDSSAASTVSGATSAVSSLSAGWIHDLFEGLLTSETKCLTCETISRRDEVFLDLSIDLDKHTSVTSCLNNFSASEMLCERNKFHCDCCGGLQEAEKRMKIKRLPRILALHLKRFKYSEEIGRHQKLFHRVVYPYYLRLFNTTDDAEDPDKLYELYAVVVHIGGGPYHGHYVTIVKTEDKGWLLFDDELVEPVDKSYVRNFFGDEKKLACAYVLFYQETTFEKMQKEMNEEGKASAAASVPLDDVTAIDSAVLKEKGVVNGDITHHHTNDDDECVERPPLTHSNTIPLPVGNGAPETGRTPAEIAAEHQVIPKSKKDRERERKEEKAAEKAAAKAAKFAAGEDMPFGETHKDKEKPFGRFRTGSKSLARGHSWFGGSGTHGKEKEKERKDVERKSYENGALHGHWDDLANHHHDTPVITNGNGTANGSADKSHEESVPPETVKEDAHDEHRDIPPSHPPPPIQSQPPPPPPPQQFPTLPLTAGKPPKEKRKGLWSGLKRKTSIMMDS